MRLPIQSETEAFRSVVLGVAIVGACWLIGYLSEPLIGIVLACVVVLALLAWSLRRNQPGSSLHEAEAAGDRRHEAPRVLLIATDTPTPEQPRSGILGWTRSRPTLEVHAPVLQSRTHFVTTDIDHETDQARQRLQTILLAAWHEGLVADGHVGDPIDTVAGVEDELRRHPADEVILTTHRDAISWVETELLERLPTELNKTRRPGHRRRAARTEVISADRQRVGSSIRAAGPIRRKPNAGVSS